MQKLNYYVLDVFTDHRYSGNQLSVVYSEKELETEQYNNIAREFGYSETSFIRYSTESNALIVRSFTPAGVEVGGAGHNLLGAVCLALIKEMDVFKGQGDIPSVIIGNTRIPLNITEENGIHYVGMKQRPAKIIAGIEASIIAPAIGLIEEDLVLNKWQSNIVQTEVAHLMVPVKDLQTLEKAVSDESRLIELSRNYAFEGYYLFTTADPHPGYIAEARFFNPLIGIDEDPATGTAAGPLAGYLEKLGYIKRNQDYQILQGAVINHPSSMHVNVKDDGVWVSGSSVVVMEGVLNL